MAWSPSIYPLTFLKTGRACLSCPKHLLCFAEEPLGLSHTLHVCPRCFCVWFHIKEMTYICGRLRWGHYVRPHLSARTAEGLLQAAILPNGWSDLPDRQATACLVTYEEEFHEEETGVGGVRGATFWSVEHPLRFCLLMPGWHNGKRYEFKPDQPQLFSSEWTGKGVLHDMGSKRNYTLNHLKSPCTSIKQLANWQDLPDEKTTAYTVIQMSTEDCMSLIMTAQRNSMEGCSSITVL